MKHFSTDEFKCKCSKQCEIGMDAVLLEALEALREAYGAPITVTSGYRCPAHNATVGGHPRSAHMAGLAVDVHGADLKRLTELALSMTCFIGVGIARGFLHLDVQPRTKRKVWKY